MNRKKRRMNRWACLLLALVSCMLVSIAPAASADTELGQSYDSPGAGIPWTDGGGHAQNYVRGEDYTVYRSGGLVYLQSGEENGSLFPGDWGFFLSGRYIVAYDGSRGDAHGAWRCYDMERKEEITLPEDIFGPFTSLFWADASGLYYTKMAENLVYHYDIPKGRETELGKTPGQPRGVVDGKVISISFTQRQVLSSRLGKDAQHQVLYQGGKDLRDLEVVNGDLYIVRKGGLYRLNGENKPERIVSDYTVIGGVSGEILLLVRKRSQGDVGLTEEVALYISDGEKVGKIGEIDAFALSVSVLNSRISADGQRLLLDDTYGGIEYSMELPPYKEWKKLPVK